MNPEKIRFNCPSCGIQLDVPAALAGVTGPCPSCQHAITAPIPQPQNERPPQPIAFEQPKKPAPAEPVFPTSQQPEQAALPQQPVVQYEVEPQKPAYEPPLPAQAAAGQNVFPTVVTEPQPEPQPQPVVHATPEEPPFPIDDSSPSSALPEPPSHDGHASQTPREAPIHSGQGVTPTKQSSRIPSLLFLLAIVILMSVIVVGILNMTGVVGLNNLKSLLGLGASETPEQGATAPLAQQSPTTIDNPIQLPIEIPEEVITPESRTMPAIPVQETVVPEQPVEGDTLQLPEGQDFREGETPLPAGLSADTSDPRAVQDILANFFSAKNLEERSPFLSTESSTNPELTTSLLNSSFPEPSSIHFLNVLNDEDENRTDFFYVVNWDGERNSPTKPITVELHKWSNSEPARVQSEAFLEFYQQKLASYAAAPQDKPAQFFVLAQCVARCFEAEDVPDHANKATLKLASFPNDRTAVKAYFDKKGEIFEQLKSHRSGLSFRKEIPLTVTLEWSNPAFKPQYLEVRIINSFDWHP